MTNLLKPSIGMFRRFVAIYGAVATLVYLFRLGGQFHNLFSFFLYFFPFLFLLFSQWSLIKTMGRSKQTLGYMLVFVGVISGTVGQLIWGYFRFFSPSFLINVIPPFFFFTTYILAFLGFVIVGKALRVKWQSNPELIVAIALLGLILAVIISGSGILSNQGLPDYVHYINLGYLLGDIVHLIVIYLIVLIVISYKGGGLFGRYWTSLFVGHFLYVVGDFTTAIFFKSYSTGHWPFTLIDLIFIGGYLFSAHGFYGLCDSVRQAQAKMQAMKKTS